MTLKESHVGFEVIQDLQLQSPTDLWKCECSAGNVDLTQSGEVQHWKLWQEIGDTHRERGQREEKTGTLGRGSASGAKGRK